MKTSTLLWILAAVVAYEYFKSQSATPTTAQIASTINPSNVPNIGVLTGVSS